MSEPTPMTKEDVTKLLLRIHAWRSYYLPCQKEYKIYTRVLQEIMSERVVSLGNYITAPIVISFYLGTFIGYFVFALHILLK